MKALFISYDQSISERVLNILDNNKVRGYTLFPITHGRGSFNGDPHLGTHAWPAVNSTILAMLDNTKLPVLMEQLRELDAQTQLQGMRAFVWDITDQM